MLNYILLYLVVLAAFFVIDMIWLGLVARKFYKKYLGFIMAEKVKWPAAIIFYLFFIFGLLFFVVIPSLGQDCWFYALWTGALFGALCYATYDLTNLATLKNWPLLVTIVDICWGAALSGTLAVIGFVFGRLIL